MFTGYMQISGGEKWCNSKYIRRLSCSVHNSSAYRFFPSACSRERQFPCKLSKLPIHSARQGTKYILIAFACSFDDSPPTASKMNGDQSVECERKSWLMSILCTTNAKLVVQVSTDLWHFDDIIIFSFSLGRNRCETRHTSSSVTAFYSSTESIVRAEYPNDLITRTAIETMGSIGISFSRKPHSLRKWYCHFSIRSRSLPSPSTRKGNQFNRRRMERRPRKMEMESEKIQLCFIFL